MAKPPTPADLGNIRSEHPGRYNDGLVGAPLIAIAGACVVVAYGLLWLGIVPIAAAVCWFGLTTTWTPHRVILRDDGLQIDRLFRSPTCVRFADCRLIFREWSVRTTDIGTGISDYILKAVDSENRVVRLNPSVIRDADHLFARLERLVIYPLNQAVKDSFEAGENVAFGGIVVSKQGARFGTKTVEWEDIRQVEMSPRVITFRINGAAPRTASVASIPFPWTLVGILKRQRVPLKFFDGFKAA